MLAADPQILMWEIVLFFFITKFISQVAGNKRFRQ